MSAESHVAVSASTPGLNGYPGLNSGMLVVNAEHWRKHGIGQRVLEYARKHQPKEADQASIEAICGEAALKLDP